LTQHYSYVATSLILGPKVVSKVITTQTIEALTTVLKRKPVIWDNIHANDYDQRRVFLGPYDGRPVELFPLLNGVLTNPNCEFESNFIAVHTLSSWLRDSSLLTAEEPMSIDLKAEKSSSSSEPMEEDLLASTESDKDSNCEKDDDQGVSQDISSSETDSESVKVEGEMETESATSLSEAKSATVRTIYNPQNALQEAVSAWLEEFSKVKHATSRTYAKSGAYSVTPEAMPITVQAPIGTCPASHTNVTTTVCSPVVTPSPIKVAKENSRKKLSTSSASGKTCFHGLLLPPFYLLMPVAFHSTPDVISFHHNFHHLYSSSAGAKYLSNDAEIRLIGSIGPA